MNCLLAPARNLWIATILSIGLGGCEPGILAGGQSDGMVRFSTGGGADCTTCICEHGGCGYDSDCAPGHRCLAAVGHGRMQCVLPTPYECTPSAPSCAAGQVCAQLPDGQYHCGTPGQSRDEARCTEVVGVWKQGGQCKYATSQDSGLAWDPRGCKTMLVHRVQHGQESDISPVAHKSLACLKAGTCTQLAFSTASCDFMRDKCTDDFILERCRQELELSGLDFTLVLAGSQTLSADGLETVKQYVCQKGKPTETQVQPCDAQKPCFRVNDTVSCSKADGSVTQAVCCAKPSGMPRWLVGQTSCPVESCAGLDGSGTCFYGTVKCSGGKGFLTCCDPTTKGPISGNVQGVWCSVSSLGDGCDANVKNSCFTWTAECVQGKCQTCAQGTANCDGLAGCECKGTCVYGECVAQGQSCSGCVGYLTSTCYDGLADGRCGTGGALCLDCAGAGMVCDKGKCVQPTAQKPKCTGCVSPVDGSCITTISDEACGSNGSTCWSCTTFGQVCNKDGQCVLDPNNNPCVGCKINGVCYQQIEDKRCGSNGSTCLDCTAVGKICQQGKCVAKTTPPPCSGCIGKSSGNCYTYTTDDLCGINGSVCLDCAAVGKVCQQGQCVTAPPPPPPPSCSGCVGQSSGNCYAFSQQLDTICGANGSICVDCTSVGQICKSGQCVTPQPSCTGCVGKSSGSCYTFSQQLDTICGASGQTCVDCTSVGKVCKSGQCVAPQTPCTGCVGKSSGTCYALAQQSNSLCGAGGQICLDCSSVGKVCQNGQCVAAQTGCSGCVGKSSGSCYTFSQQLDTICGANGSTCVDCTSVGKVCKSGQCVTPQPSCTGCIGKSSGSCYTFSQQFDTICGANGQTCVDCTSVGKQCFQGQCI